LPFSDASGLQGNQEKIFVRMVYGLSKATWNYGWWNMLFDEFLVYGNYDAKILSFYGPTVKIGNPKFDDWFNGNVEPYPVEPNKKPYCIYPLMMICPHCLGCYLF